MVDYASKPNFAAQHEGVAIDARCALDARVDAGLVFANGTLARHEAAVVEELVVCGVDVVARAVEVADVDAARSSARIGDGEVVCRLGECRAAGVVLAVAGCALQCQNVVGSDLRVGSMCSLECDMHA